MDRIRNGELFLNIGHTLDHLFLLIFPTAILAMTPEFGLSYKEMLPLALGAFIAFGACSIPAGWLADRWSRHGMMVVFFTGIGLASILTGFAQTPWQIAAGLTLIGIFGAIYHPVGIAMLVSGRDKVGKVLGVNGVFGNMGIAFAALLTGALAHWISWRAAFVVPGLVSIAFGVAFAVLVDKDVGQAKSARKAQGAAGGLSRGMLARVFSILAVTTVCGGFIFNSTTIAMPKVFDERLTALTNTTLGIGVLVALVYAFAAVAQLVVGHYLDRRSIKQVFVPIAAFQVPLLLIAGSVDNYLMLMVALAMMFFIFGQVPINDAMVAAYSDERWRSRVFAVRYVVSFGASAASVPLVAWVHGSTGDFKYLFFLLSAIAAVLLVATIMMPGQVRPQPAAVSRQPSA